LAEKIPASALIITESGILSPIDVERLERAGAGAMLVGESLMRQADVTAATRALLATPQRST
jgi:indole-3-glycerol phosphate synthase